MADPSPATGTACAGDPPSQVFAERCRRFLAWPPPADWDGIFVPEGKSRKRRARQDVRLAYGAG